MANRVCYFFAWMFLGVKCLWAASEIDIELAIQNKALSAQFQADGSGYFGQCMQVMLQNNTSNSLIIIISAGQTMTPVESRYQNMIVTKTEKIKLPPNGSYSGLLYAACIEAKDYSPRDSTKYLLASKATGKLLEIVTFVEKKQYQNQLGSMAIWVVTDGFSIDNVISDDKTATSELVALLTKLTPQKPSASRTKIKPVINTLETDFIFTISETISGAIGIYDTSGTLVQEIMKERPFIPGTHELHVRMRSNVILKGQTYFLRLIVTGKAIRENKIFIPM